MSDRRVQAAYVRVEKPQALPQARCCFFRTFSRALKYFKILLAGMLFIDKLNENLQLYEIERIGNLAL